MIKGNPHPAYKFPKGNKLGKGQPIVPPEVREAKKIVRADYIQIIKDLSNKPVDDILRIASDKKENILRACVASAMLWTHKKGEPQRLEILMQRVVGKVKERVELDAKVDSDINLSALPIDVMREILATIKKYAK